MKTTVEIPDQLLDEVKEKAEKEGTTVRALIEEGLRKVLASRSQARSTFKLKKATYRGKGLQPDVESGSWERIRELIYEGRGA